MRSTIAVVLMVLLTTPAIAELTANSKAQDWITATTADKLLWVTMISPRLKSLAATPGCLAGCIIEMLTPRNREERQVSDMLKHNTLAELACCVL